MTGAMRKMGVYLGLVEEDLHDDLEAPDSAARTRSYDREEAAARSARGRGEERFDYRYDYDDTQVDEVAAEPAPLAAERAGDTERSRSDRYAALRTEEPPAARHRITTLHPRTYNEARTIGEQFRDGNPVIMNLSEMDDADAKRLVDFAAGLTFGLRGSIERVTAKVFLLSPQKVKVTAEDKARIADGRYPVRG